MCIRDSDIDNGYYSMLPDNTTDGGSDSEKSTRATEEIKEKRYFDYRPTKAAINYALKYSIVELAITLFTFALFVNSAILIVAGSTLYGSDEAVDADLYTIHHLLSKTLAPVAGTIFMLALLLSGQSAGIVCTIAGQIVSEGHLNWTMTPWKRRIVTRAISIIPVSYTHLDVYKRQPIHQVVFQVKFLRLTQDTHTQYITVVSRHRAIGQRVVRMIGVTEVPPISRWPRTILAQNPPTARSLPSTLGVPPTGST